MSEPTPGVVSIRNLVKRFGSVTPGDGVYGDGEGVVFSQRQLVP